MVLFRLKIVKFQAHFFFSISIFWFAIFLAILRNINLSEEALFLPYTSSLLYLLLCLGYVAESTALENESPSMRIIKSILKNSGRVSIEELKTKFTDREFIDDRIGDLVRNGHMDYQDGIYRLTYRGTLIARIIKRYREIIHRGMGG